MRKAVMVALALAVAGCSQTTNSAALKPEAAIAPPPPPAKHAVAKADAEAVAAHCTEAANQAVKAQTNAAMMGGALSMVGGLGGFGGRGGMVAAQAASVGGSVIQSQASAKSQEALYSECQ